MREVLYFSLVNIYHYIPPRTSFTNTEQLVEADYTIILGDDFNAYLPLWSSPADTIGYEVKEHLHNKIIEFSKFYIQALKV